MSERVWARSMRKKVIEMLQFSGERAVQAGESIGIGRECVERLVQKECPLPFTGRVQYMDFCDELGRKVEQGLGLSPIQDNLAQHVKGFWIAFARSSRVEGSPVESSRVEGSPVESSRELWILIIGHISNYVKGVCI